MLLCLGRRDVVFILLFVIGLFSSLFDAFVIVLRFLFV